MLVLQVGVVKEMRDDAGIVTRASEVERVESAAASQHPPCLAA